MVVQFTVFILISLIKQPHFFIQTVYQHSLFEFSVTNEFIYSFFVRTIQSGFGRSNQTKKL